MKSSVVKILSAIVAILPASAQVMAGIDAGNDRELEKPPGMLTSGTSVRITNDALQKHLRANLPGSAEINHEILNDAVFGLNHDGSLEIIGSKVEIKKLIRENNELKRRILEASDVAPSCD